MNTTQQTSMIAHENFMPKKHKHHKIIWDVLMNYKKHFPNGMNSLQISELCELSYHQVARRLKELENDEIVFTNGRSVYKKSTRTLWKLT